MLRTLNKSCKYTGANLLRDLNITTAFCYFFRPTERVHAHDGGIKFALSSYFQDSDAITLVTSADVQ